MLLKDKRGLSEVPGNFHYVFPHSQQLTTIWSSRGLSVTEGKEGLVIEQFIYKSD